MSKTKILAFSVGRSDFDRYFPILEELRKIKKIDLKLALSQIHSFNIFGKTINEVKKKKFKIIEHKKISKKKNFSEFFLPDEIIFLINIIKEYRPDIIIALGDRYEMLAAPCAALTFNIPVIHIYGGAVTQGAIDDLVRHSISKLSSFHLVATAKYKKRLIQLGEEKWRIKNIGVPELNYLKKIKKIPKNQLNHILKIDINKKTLLVNFHPVTTEINETKKYILNLLSAIKKSNLQVIFTYPNADKSNEIIIKEINKFIKRSKESKYIFIKNAGADLYSNLLRKCYAMVGNSSSGIVEAASFKLPVINLGNRQKGKVFPANVIQSSYKEQDISKSIKKIASYQYQKKLKKLINPYENKITKKQIASLIANLKIDNNLKIKKFKDIL